MRVLLLTSDPTSGAGGIEGRAVRYTRGLLARGVHVEVAALSSRGKEGEEGYHNARLVRLSASPLRLPNTFLALVRIMTRSSLDSVFILSGGATGVGILVLLFTRLTGRRSGAFFYGRDILQSRRRIWGRLALVLSARAAGRVGVNSRYTGRLLSYTGVRGVTIIYPGVDLGVAGGFPGGAEGSQPRILFVGRLVERKGADLLLAAFGRVRAEFPDLRLDIVGDGPERKKLVALAGSLGLGEVVTFYGAVYGRELWELYAGARLFVMPARESSYDVEGFGTVFLEAAAFGVPSVGTRTGGIPEAIVDGVTGRLVDGGDAEGLGEALESLLKDPGLSAQLGANARARAREFTWEKSTDCVLSLLGADPV